MSNMLGVLSPKRIGAIYVWIALIILFSILSPYFAEYATVSQVLNQYAVTGLIALGLLLPLAAGIYDLLVGSVVGLAGMTAAWFLRNVSDNPFLAIAAGLCAALIVGLINSVVLLVLRVDSFIGTLATSSIVTALVVAISNNNVITFDPNGPFSELLAINNVFDLRLPVAMWLVVVLILAYVMEATAFGRRMYAIGFDQEVARLGGIRVDRMRMLSLLASSFLAGLAGVCASAALSAGDPSVGPGYLLAAFAAAFLGATQFRRGRFNPWGTLVAVLLLGSANVGLLLSGSPTWGPDIFAGALLIVAVALTHSHTKFLRRFRRRKPGPLEGAPSSDAGDSSLVADGVTAPGVAAVIDKDRA